LCWDAFSGNVRGLGPASAEMEFVEREAEPFPLFMADKTGPGAYNLPLYLAFCDPMFAPGLILSPKFKEEFRFTIMDVHHTEGDRVVELDIPENLYDVAALLRDNHRFAVESIRTRSTNEIAAVVSTSRLHNISGNYSGKDDPVMLVRVQSQFPATGEMLSPFRLAHYVSGFSRGSHHGPLMPVKINSPISFFDGPPIVSCIAFSMKDGKFAEPADAFDHPFWDQIRVIASRKAIEIRDQRCARRPASSPDRVRVPPPVSRPARPGPSGRRTPPGHPDPSTNPVPSDLPPDRPEAILAGSGRTEGKPCPARWRASRSPAPKG
jgi:fructose 1,6-bisphosphate aldolase/phosphatase